MPARSAGMRVITAKRRPYSEGSRMADTVQTWTPALRVDERAARRASGLQRFMRRRSTIAFLMCLPLIVIIAGLVIYPALYSIYLSMLNKAQTRFIGLAISPSCCRATCSGWWSSNRRFSRCRPCSSKR